MKPVRHMLYHIWPYRSGRWRTVVKQLLPHIEDFDGSRAIGVVTDEQSDSLEEVQSAFAGHRIDRWIHRENRPDSGQSTTFLPLLKTLPRSENHITWYGHAKSSWQPHHPQASRLWSNVLHRLTLTDWPAVETLLQAFPVVGCFKRYTGFGYENHAPWHYSGTFFLFRNDQVFRRLGWAEVVDTIFGVEAWPARLFSAEEAGCLFFETQEDLNLYFRETWETLRAPLAEKGIFFDFDNPDGIFDADSSHTP